MRLDVDGTRVRGTWLRHVPAGADPALPPTPPDDNRWQRGAVVDALYLADSAACAWAEWYRHLAERGLPPHTVLPRDLWRYEVDRTDIADLRDADRLARVGLAVPAPGRATWPAFQEVGEGLHAAGWPGLLAPSAARPDSLVLVVFLPGPAIPGELVAVDSVRIAQPPVPPTGMRT